MAGTGTSVSAGYKADFEGDGRVISTKQVEISIFAYVPTSCWVDKYYIQIFMLRW